MLDVSRPAGLLIYFDRRVHRQLRVLAAERDTTMSAIVRAAVQRVLRERDQPPGADGVHKWHSTQQP